MFSFFHSIQIFFLFWGKSKYKPNKQTNVQNLRRKTAQSHDCFVFFGKFGAIFALSVLRESLFNMSGFKVGREFKNQKKLNKIKEKNNNTNRN